MTEVLDPLAYCVLSFNGGIAALITSVRRDVDRLPAAAAAA